MIAIACAPSVVRAYGQANHNIPVSPANPTARTGNTPAKNFETYAKQAESAQKAGHEEEAIAFYLKALEINQRWAEGWLRMGMLLADRKQFVQAGKAFKNVIELKPKVGLGWALLGLCEYREGHLNDAYNHMEYGRTLGIGNSDLEKVTTYHSALVMLREKEFIVAHHLLVHLAREGAQDSDLITAFGLAALRIPKAPDQVNAASDPLIKRVGQIEMDATHSSTQVIIQQFKQLLSDVPNQPNAHYAFGSFLIGAGHFQEGIDQMKQVLALNPHDDMAMLQVAMTYLNQGGEKEALPYAEHAVKLAPRLFAAHYALGWTLYKLGQVPRAAKELQLAEQLSPNSPDVHYALSVVYLHSNQPKEAQRERQIFARMKQKQAASQLAPAARAAPDKMPNGGSD